MILNQMLSSDCIRFIESVACELKVNTGIDPTDEKNMRDVFKTLIGSLQKGAMRSEFIKNIDSYFEYFSEKLTSDQKDNTIHLDTQQRMLRILSSTNPAQIYNALSTQESVSSREILHTLFMNPNYLPHQIAELILNHPMTSASNQPTFYSIAHHISYQLALHKSIWLNKYPVSTACILSLCCIHNTIQIDQLIVLYIIKNQAYILASMISFSIYWYEQFDKTHKKNNKTNFILHLSTLLRLFTETETMDSENTIECDIHICMSLLLYSSWMHAHNSDIITSVSILMRYLKKLNHSTNGEAVSQLSNIGLLVDGSLNIASITEENLMSWVYSSSNTVMRGYVSNLRDGIASEKESDKEMKIIETLDRGNTDKEYEDVDINITYEVDGGKSIIDTLDSMAKDDHADNNSESADEVRENEVKKVLRRNDEPLSAVKKRRKSSSK